MLLYVDKNKFFKYHTRRQSILYHCTITYSVGV